MAVSHLKGRDFLRVEDWSAQELAAVLDLADRLKGDRRGRRAHPLLEGRTLGLILEKPSLRTQVSFAVAMAELGGVCVQLGMSELQLGRREPIRDAALVLSRYLDAIAIRTYRQADVDELAEHADVPVVNALTDEFHPCQALADLMTVRERFGGLEGVRVGYVGDGNNVCHSLMVACAKLGVDVAVATPPGYEPASEVVVRAREAAAAGGGSVDIASDPAVTAKGANVLYTDVWTSMGHEEERDRRLRDFEGFTVDADLLAQADESAIVLHCLPAHAGEEISAEVLYGPRSAAWDQAENRLHTQKALLALIVP